MSQRKKRRPERVGQAVASFLGSSAVGSRVEQAKVVPEWPRLVGAQIASVTEPLRVTRDGTLFVAVQTSAWMAELSMMERELLLAVNVDPARPKITKIHWLLMR